MIDSTFLHFIRVALIAMLGLAACNPLAAHEGQKRQYVVQADLEKIGKRGGDGKYAEQAVEASVEIIKRRLGVGAHRVFDEGDGRIIIEITGDHDREAIESILGIPADLEFRMVDLDATPEDIERGIAPEGSEILQMHNGSRSLAIKRLGGIDGMHVVDARQGIDIHISEPHVALQFDKEGAEKLAELTRENVGLPLAIILNGKVISAPVINEPILGGSLQISGGFSVESTRLLAIKLRSGALPVPFEIVEEREVK